MHWRGENSANGFCDEIGKMLGVTKECVRQTEIRAIKHLKAFFVAKDMDLSYCQ